MRSARLWCFPYIQRCFVSGNCSDQLSSHVCLIEFNLKRCFDCLRNCGERITKTIEAHEERQQRPSSKQGGNNHRGRGRGRGAGIGRFSQQQRKNDDEDNNDDDEMDVEEGDEDNGNHLDANELKRLHRQCCLFMKVCNYSLSVHEV